MLHEGKSAGEQTAVLVLGGGRQTLAVARAVGPRGRRVVLGLPSTEPQSYITRSRWIAEVWHHPPLDASVDAFLEALSHFLDAHPDVRFVLPIGNREVAALSALRPRLPGQVRYVMPNNTAIRVCGDKNAALGLANRLALPVAPFRQVDEPQQLLDAADRLGYPCVIKSTTESARILGMKAFVAAARDELCELVGAAGSLQGPFIVQRYVAGDRHCLYFFASHGDILASAQVRVERTDRANGTGYAVAGISVEVSPHWLDHLRRICRDLEYTGFGGLQYLRDPDTGEESFLEINARLGGNHAGLERLGMHQVHWAIEQLESGKPSIPVPFEYPVGVRYRWFYGDLMGFMHEWKTGTLKRRAAIAWGLTLPTTLFGPGHLNWSWRDPQPAACLALDFIRPIYRRIRGKAARTRRLLAENPVTARQHRSRAWDQLLRAAEVEGIEPRSLARVYDYLSVITKVHPPKHVHFEQRPSRYFSGLSARPFHDPTAFPWRSLLEDNFAVIHGEVMAARESSRFKPHHQNLTDAGRWDTLYFYTGNRKVERSHALWPRTAGILADIPRAGNNGQVYVSVLSGHTHIKAHCGPTNVRLRCHFGIDVPDGSRLRVGSTIVPWEAGRCLFFDDSFEHEVWNFGDEERVVIIIDFWHPDLTHEERWAIEQISLESESIRQYQRSVAT